jgi:DNA-binding transcriptional regulator GbsR (MarR family)
MPTVAVETLTRRAPALERAMVFNSKQLEELENIHDSTGAFEEEGDEEGFTEEGGEAAMDWRRALIEEASENIKRSRARPVEPHLTYPINSMLFDREARRFARVQRSVPGYLKIVYLSGGDREYGSLDVTMYLREHGASRRLSELSEQLGMNEVDVANELERLGIVPLEEEEPLEDEHAHAHAAVPESPPAFIKAKKPVFKDVVDEEEELEDELEEEEEEEVEEDEVEEELADDEDDDDGDDIPAMPRGKNAAKPVPAAKATAKMLNKPVARPVPVAAKASAKAAPAAPTKSAAKPVVVKPVAGKPAAGKPADPIADPNSYIKAHFHELSNRELAKVTGLSEHTIRRKLGEWGLKRKKEA